MLTNQFIRDQLAQITNAKRITIYVGMNEFHALVMNGLNQSMKFEGHDVVNVRLQSYFRIEVEYEKNIAKLTVSIDASEARKQTEKSINEVVDLKLIKQFIRDIAIYDKSSNSWILSVVEDSPVPEQYLELVKKAWED